MPSVTLQAPAKINLFLHLTGKRADGYHLLESLVVFTELADSLTLHESDTLSLRVEGEFAGAAGDVEQNLVMRAARVLAAEASKPCHAAMRLTKHIPVGAGLGGGSADAAAALRGLNRFWGLNLSQRDLRDIAIGLGADVAMCLDSQPALVHGIGELITPVLPAPPLLPVLLVHPGVPLLTKDVYAATRMGDEGTRWQPASMHPHHFLATLQPTRNHLQRAAISLDSRVAEVLLALETLQPAPKFVRMSGSGACCFALFIDAEEAQRAAASLAHQHPEWWVQTTRLKA